MKIAKKKKMKVKLVAKMDTMIQRESEGAVLVSKNTDNVRCELNYINPQVSGIRYFESSYHHHIIVR